MLTGMSLGWLRLKGVCGEADVDSADFGSDRVPLLSGGGNRAMLRRPPTSFALFLKSQKGKLKKFKCVKYTKKTTVFRFDLLKLRFESLMQADRDVYIEASGRASEELARVRSSAVDGSQIVRADATQISAIITLPANAGGDAMPSDTAVAGSQTGHADATQIPVRITLPATAGADAMPADVSPNWSVRATEGSPARACVAAASASVRFTDIASGVQKVFQLVSDGQLGKGGWRSCRLLEDVATGNLLCCKFDSHAESGADASRDHLRRELLAMSRLCHPNVLKAYGLCYGPGDRVECLLMPLCNRDFRSWIQDRPADALASTTVSGPLRCEER